MIKIEKTNITQEFLKFTKKEVNDSTVLMITGTEQEVDLKLKDVLNQLLQKNKIYFFCTGLDDCIEVIKDCFSNSMLFYVTNGKNVFNPYREIYIDIKNSKNIEDALGFWTGSNPEIRGFVINNNKNINSILDIYNNFEILILCIPSYMGYGFYIVCENDEIINF